MRLSLAFVVPWALVACRAASTQAPPAAEPYVLVLGTAQDGGVPQLACTCANCRAARADPARRRLVTSLLGVPCRCRELDVLAILDAEGHEEEVYSAPRVFGAGL